jgi:pimeloyl-ACP methyl ester carboxylesterase
MRSRRLIILAAIIIIVAAGIYAATPYVRAASLIVRAASLGGRAEAFANAQAHSVTQRPKLMVPTRHGNVAAQLYVPDGDAERTLLLMPGINSTGVDEPRVIELATDLAGSGFNVMALALPDLMQYRITPKATDVIEDAVAWMTEQPELAGDGRIGITAVSFSGGLSISAASRERIRNKIAFILALGGHGDLRRVMRYLATGITPTVEGMKPEPPHDYGVAVILYGLADRGAVPIEQVPALRSAIETFLLASQLTVSSQEAADKTFARAREMAAALPEPSRTYMNYVNDRAVSKLGPILVPHLDQLGADDPALSPELAPPPAAPVYLLHGNHDNIIPPAESVLLGNYLRTKGAEVDVLLSGLITHAQVSESATASDAWELIRFWAGILKQ